jgi:hypothetical protein
MWTACYNTAGVTTYVFCGLDTFNNLATSVTANQVARYSQMFRQNGAGPSWSAVTETRDYTANPTTQAVSSEMDLWATDGDNNGERVVLDVVAGPIPGVSGHNPTLRRILRLGAANGNASAATIINGLVFGPATWSNALIASEGNPTTFSGIDFSGVTFNGYSLNMPNFTVDGLGNIIAHSLTTSGQSTFVSSTAPPAGGAQGSCILVSSTAHLGLCWGSGVPTLSAAQGSLYMRTDGTSSNRLYVNNNGTTGWTAY